MSPIYLPRSSSSTNSISQPTLYRKLGLRGGAYTDDRIHVNSLFDEAIGVQLGNNILIVAYLGLRFELDRALILGVERQIKSGTLSSPAHR